MQEIPLVTDSDLARARQDADFRQQLLTESLERLLGELSKLQRSANNSAQADQVREGVELAVKLADLLRRIAPQAA
jgi:N-glycosylase/DNA lyase